MSRHPQITVTRRSPLGGGTVPGTLKPGELYVEMSGTGVPSLYVGSASGHPVLVVGGGGGGGAPTIPTVKPNNPAPGQLWYDAVADKLNVFSQQLADWREVFDDADLMAHDGTRAATGTFDMDGNDIDDAGTITATAVEGAVINGGSF